MTEQLTIDLSHPLYLDVPMMTSFLAAIDDGIAYGSSVRRKLANQRSSGRGAEANAGTTAPSLFSMFNLSFRGHIERQENIEDSEEIELARKHTEASLFMHLRGILHHRQLITTIEAIDSFNQVEHGSLIEVTGQISRSPLSSHLDAIFQYFEFFGVDLPDDYKQLTQDPTSKSPQRQKGGNQPPKQQYLMDPIAQLEQIVRLGEQGSAVQNVFVLKLLQRIREDLEHTRVKDVVLQPVGAEELTVLIALSSEFLPPGTLENLLSGHFTVLGKVVRKLVGNETISLYDRSPRAALVNSQQDLKDAIAQAGSVASPTSISGGDIINAPGIQVIPLAIFV